MDQFSINFSNEFEPSEPQELFCPMCSQRLSDLTETYFVGCPQCYKVFGREIEKLATNYHGRCVHSGKTINHDVHIQKIEKQLKQLSEDERKAVINRDYILADEIKHKIKLLREQM